MAYSEVFTEGTGQEAGLVVSTGILGDLVLPAGAFDPEHADEIRELAAPAAVIRCAVRPLIGLEHGPRSTRNKPL
jgi:hypothetical protein